MQVPHYNDDCYIEYGTRVNGPDDKWHDNVYSQLQESVMSFSQIAMDSCFTFTQVR